MNTTTQSSRLNLIISRKRPLALNALPYVLGIQHSRSLLTNQRSSIRPCFGLPRTCNLIERKVRLSAKRERKKSEPPLSTLFSLPPSFLSVQMTSDGLVRSTDYGVDG